MKILKSCIPVIFVILKSLALKQDLLLKQWEPSALEQWIIDMIPWVVGNGTTNYVFMVNFHLQTKDPIIALDTRKTPLPDFEKWYDFSLPILFCVRIYNMDELYEVVNRLLPYRDFFNSGKILMILPGRPTKEIGAYFKRIFIFYIVFVEVTENDNFLVYDSYANSVSNDFPTRIKYRKIAKLNVCYSENTPYTFIPPASKGIEQALVDLVGRTLQINVTYTKQDLPPSCHENATHRGIWDTLYNHSCDAVIGLKPCMKFFRDFDLVPTHLTDATVVIVPKVACPRFVGFVPIQDSIMKIIIFTYILVKLILFGLSRSNINVSPRQFFDDLKLQGSRLVILTCLLAAIIFNVIYQAKIYYSLVHNQETCGLQSLNDIWERKEHVGVEAMIYRYESIFHNMSLDVLRGLWTADEDMENLDVNKPHLLRSINYNYLLPKRYTTANRETTFRKIETSMQFTINIFFYKAHYILPNVSAALLFIQQSALRETFYVIEGNAKRAEAIAKETAELLSHFTPIKLKEVGWLFRVHFKYGIFTCVLVFIGEILIANYRRILDRYLK